MAKFRKKPVVIEAWQFDGDTDGDETKAYPSWLLENMGIAIIPMDDHILIKTLEGDMRANKDDWIIKGVNGELYPCKPDIFEKTYEPVV